jgi:phosphatidate cytidylyltransferase
LSNLTIRILAAIVGIPILILLSYLGGLFFLLLVVLCSSVALYEFYKLSQAKGAKPQIILGLIAGGLINLSFYHNKLQNFSIDVFRKVGLLIPFPSQSNLFFILIISILVVLLIVELFRNSGSPLLNLSSTMLGIIYVAGFFGTFIGLRELFIPFDFPASRFFTADEISLPQTLDKIYRWGGYTIISVFIIIWICDTAAYFGGRLLGKHKLFVRISPNKTWEGAIFGFIFAIVAAVAMKYILLDYLSIESAVVLGFIVGVFGQIGDLVESMFKRNAGVKDSSSLIPGHGGALDRFDSLLFVAPLVYLYLDFVVFT